MSVTLATITGYVQNITKRVDLVAETEQAIRKVILRAHQKDFWNNDLKVTNFSSISTAPVTNDTLVITVDTSNVTYFNRARKFTGIREYSALIQNPKTYVKKDPNNLQDDYNVDFCNIWYQVGTNLILRPYAMPTGISVSWYQYPDVVSGFSSWIADQFPFEIASLAAAEIFKLVGKDDEAAKYRQEEVAFYSNLYTVGLV